MLTTRKQSCKWSKSKVLKIYMESSQRCRFIGCFEYMKITNDLINLFDRFLHWELSKLFETLFETTETSLPKNQSKGIKKNHRNHKSGGLNKVRLLIRLYQKGKMNKSFLLTHGCHWRWNCAKDYDVHNSPNATRRFESYKYNRQILKYYFLFCLGAFVDYLRIVTNLVIIRFEIIVNIDFMIHWLKNWWEDIWRNKENN